jgi:spermidine synthase
MKKTVTKLLHKETSPISGEIKVMQRGDTRELLVNDVKQSIWTDNQEKFRNSYWEGVVNVPYKIKTTPSILILGTGAATIPKLLSAKYPKCKITCIEIDPAIIQISKDFFNVSEYKQIKIIEADAKVWLEQNKDSNFSKYDIICLDTFLSENFSLETNHETMVNILHVLKNSGILITNRIYGEEFTPVVEAYITSLGNYFSEIRLRTIAGFTGSDNIIIYAKNDVR